MSKLGESFPRRRGFADAARSVPSLAGFASFGRQQVKGIQRFPKIVLTAMSGAIVRCGTFGSTSVGTSLDWFASCPVAVCLYRFAKARVLLRTLVVVDSYAADFSFRAAIAIDVTS